MFQSWVSAAIGVGFWHRCSCSFGQEFASESVAQHGSVVMEFKK